MDATLKEANIWRSVKKFFVDNFTSTPVYFDRIITKPSQSAPDQWITVLVENPTPAHVSTASMTVFIFSKQDRSGDELAQTRDDVIELLSSGTVDLYDSNWSKVGGLFVSVDGQSKTMYNPDQSKMLYIQTTLRWGAVWS